jgi:hypothetical protein
VSDECRTYVACQAAIDATVDVSNYEEGGSCWSQAAVAFSCTEQCKEALRALRATPRPPDVCAVPAT